MKNSRRDIMIRGSISLMILLAGLAMIPFVNLPTNALGWELFAGIYAPDLSVNETTGAPGSIFAFTGSNYPASSMATVYVNGEAVGTVMTDGNGDATFLLNTAGSIPGQYNVTMEVDINASATQSIELIAGDPTVTPPPGFPPEPSFSIGNPIYLPVIAKN
ncbi:MAG: hypothetical protein R3335_00785 [Anaerolineales bacterium]|nr:hypothetical protein [Anaerolineales bacterium]